MPISELEILFRLIISEIDLILKILYQFLVAIPDRSNLSIFDNSFKCLYEVLCRLRIKID